MEFYNSSMQQFLHHGCHTVPAAALWYVAGGGFAAASGFVRGEVLAGGGFAAATADVAHFAGEVLA